MAVASAAFGRSSARLVAVVCAAQVGLYDFRPVFRNSSAMAYCIHTLEMSALRGRGVGFLCDVAATTCQRSAKPFLRNVQFK
jgi:hypothetical protein